jgi:membrane-associated protease RseP (regulator of RpoE activity)
MPNGNGHSNDPIPVIDLRAASSAPPEPPPRRRRSSRLIPLVLFVLTVLSTMLIGAHYALAYDAGHAPFSPDDDFFPPIFSEPALLLTGLPFSFTLMSILLAHELGHYFACRYYRISATVPYFIPFPSIIGTLGAFIRIRSPIVNRKALFDVGLSGPVVGFLFALPALAIALLYSKVAPGAQADSLLAFGDPPLVRALAALLRPGVPAEDLLLHPVGRAAWVGLFATALNLLPAGQLDGGHIVYALSSRWHRRISFSVALLIAPLGYFWEGWWLWAALLLLFGFRHPVLLDPHDRLDRPRRAWALIALVIFALCFTPAPLIRQ